MKLSYLFIANAAFALLGALGLILMPDNFWANYGANLNEAGKFASQVMGTILLGIVAISYLAKDIKDQKALKAILTGFIIAHSGSGLVSLMAVLSGILNQMTWVDVIIHAAFAAGFLYYLQTERR